MNFKATITNYYIKHCAKKFPLMNINLESDYVNRFRVIKNKLDISS